MSTFACKARRVTIEPHPNADAIELARVDDYLSIVRKGEYASGDLAVYIPEQAIVPETILLDLGLHARDENSAPLYENGALKGGLSGPEGDRVKALRLRGIVSQGLLYRRDGLDLSEGEDYADALGIKKWQPEVPEDMVGKLVPCSSLKTFTDIENIKSYPDVFDDGEPVVATEKTHGIASIYMLILDSGELVVSSKGFAKQGLALVDELDDEGRVKNVYWRAAHRHDLHNTLLALATLLPEAKETVTLYGETYGVQDLRYGTDSGEPGFLAFDIAVDGQYLDYERFRELSDAVGVRRTPVIYEGPFSSEAIWAAASGREQVSGQELHIREGVVVRPLIERHELEIGRVIVKVVSEDYLLRKNEGATEYE